MKNLVMGSLLLVAASGAPGLAAVPRTLPPEVYGQMKGGSKLASVWISPGFDRAQGFRAGPVESRVSSIYGPAAVQHFPGSLARLAEPASANVLSLTVVELRTRERGANNYASVTLGVEGRILAGDGTLLAAFAGRKECNSATGLVANCEGAADLIVAALARELGMELHRPVKAVSTVAEAAPGKPPKSGPHAIDEPPAESPAPPSGTPPVPPDPAPAPPPDKAPVPPPEKTPVPPPDKPPVPPPTQTPVPLQQPAATAPRAAKSRKPQPEDPAPRGKHY
jgi:hypothetical protein